MSNQELPGKDKLLCMYKKMYEIRCLEEKLYQLFLTEPMPGTMHQSTGQEAIAVGVCENLRQDDYVISTHRGHGQYIAKGGSLNKIMAEMFAKKTGCCRGMGGSMHLTDIKVGILVATAIVGAGIPIATGAALSSKLKRTDQVTACFFGEGASNTGAFHEGINLAAVWKLPVIFICENNLYGFSTFFGKTTLVANVADRASSYGIPGTVVDGNDVLAVYKVAKEAVVRARQKEGPTLIECKTYRHRGHGRFEPAQYRPAGEVEKWRKRDPIVGFKIRLLELGIPETEITTINHEVKTAVEDSVIFAKNSPDPEYKDIFKYVFAEKGDNSDSKNH